MIRQRRLVSVRALAVVAIILGLTTLPFVRSQAATGACAAPATDLGSVTTSVNVPTAGTYRIWTRIATPTAVTAAYSLEIDGSSCFAVNGSQLPVFTSGSTTRFGSTATNWTGSAVGGQILTANLTAGAHTLKMIGTADGVVVDRVVLTQDTACSPTGVGTNCSSPPDTTAPVVAITAPAANATLGTTTTVTATATDDTAISKVEFYADTTLFGTDTSATNGNVYSASLTSSSLSAGTHQLKAIAYDTSNNPATSSIVTVTVAGTNPPPQTYDSADINSDGKVNYIDLSMLASNYGKTGAAISPRRADINVDNVVNHLDLSALASKYGQ